MWYSLFRGRFWGCGPSRGASGAAALISMDMEAVEAIGLLLLCSVVAVAVVVVVIGASSPAAAAAASAAARFE